MYLERISSLPESLLNQTIVDKTSAIKPNQIDELSQKISAIIFQSLGSRSKANLMQKVMKTKGPPHDPLKVLFVQLLQEKGQRESQQGKIGVRDGTQGLGFLIAIQKLVRKSLKTYFSKTETLYHYRLGLQISDREGEKLTDAFNESIRKFHIQLDRTEIPNDYSLTLELDHTESEKKLSLHFILTKMSEEVEISKETFPLPVPDQEEDSFEFKIERV